MAQVPFTGCGRSTCKARGPALCRQRALGTQDGSSVCLTSDNLDIFFKAKQTCCSLWPQSPSCVSQSGGEWWGPGK